MKLALEAGRQHGRRRGTEADYVRQEASHTYMQQSQTDRHRDTHIQTDRQTHRHSNNYRHR